MKLPSMENLIEDIAEVLGDDPTEAQIHELHKMISSNLLVKILAANEARKARARKWAN